MHLDLYLVTDSDLTRGRPLLRVVAQALEGGVTAVQLRDKKAAPRDLLEPGGEMRRISHHHRALFIVNDRVDLAMALEADGVHVGPEDLPPAEARRLMPGPALLGVSASNVREAVAAQEAGADYLGVGPIFRTLTKPDAGLPMDLAALSEIAASVKIPVVAIGGINAENAGSVIEAGAAGVAVISALMGAEDPEATAREILVRVGEARRSRGATESGWGSGG